ncbi:hypothetical protein AB7M45_006242 [Bradyrhizobium elkanii]|uniref:hypothetical protein n=1 Tax=Bradyrhizobium elkanii TaxID=29448 RepID=UPI000310FAF3|nr:hypothetical protein [Bradyrhizobium elkanii]
MFVAADGNADGGGAAHATPLPASNDTSASQDCFRENSFAGDMTGCHSFVRER